jgi:hypothetical protein
VRRAPRTRALLAAIAAALLAGCQSPESERRPGESGADVGNRGSEITLHERSEPFHDTPDRGAGH